MPEMKRVHPACAKWPRPSSTEFQALVADIRVKGLLDAIWLTATDEILEGKIRYEACLQAGVEPHFETYTGDDPIGFTISRNKLRRHMTPTQLAFIGEELAKLQLGTNRYQKKVDSLTSESTSQGRVAQQLGISKKSLEEVRALNKYGEPNVIELARTGQVGLQIATAYSRHTPREEQRTADRKIVKEQGARMRTPCKNGITGKPKTSTTKAKKSPPPTITFSPEQIRVLEEKLRPFIKRLRVQAKKPIVEFSPFELERIAFDMDKLLDDWANVEADADRRTADPSTTVKASG